MFTKFFVLIQVCFTFPILFLLYMLFALFDYTGGFPNFVGIILFQPLMAIFFSIITIFICGIFGLPIRLNRRINTFWKNHFYLAISLALLGLILCGISIHPNLVEEITWTDCIEYKHLIPNMYLSISGWFMVGFGLFHTFIPLKIEHKIKHILTKIKQIYSP